MRPRLLTDDEYKATFSPPMLNVTDSADEVVDLWGYANVIIEEDFHNCTAWDWHVKFIYEAKDGSYQHINIPVPKDNTYLSVVVDLPRRRIMGHYLLDLGALYPNWKAAGQPGQSPEPSGTDEVPIPARPAP